MLLHQDVVKPPKKNKSRPFMNIEFHETNLKHFLSKGKITYLFSYLLNYYRIKNE